MGWKSVMQKWPASVDLNTFFYNSVANADSYHSSSYINLQMNSNQQKDISAIE